MKKYLIYLLSAAALLVALWTFGYTFIVSAIVAVMIIATVVIFLLWSGVGTSKATKDEKPNIIPDDTESIYIDPIWSYVISAIVVVIGSLISYVVVSHIIGQWIFSNIFDIFGVNEAENYTMYLSNGMWFLAVISGLAYIYSEKNKLTIRTGDCGVITFLGDRIAPIGGTIYYLGEGNHWTISKLIDAIPVTITKHKIEFQVSDELSKDNVKMKMSGFLLYGIRIPNNHAAYKEEIKGILTNLCISASRMGLRSISMTQGVGTVSPVSDSKAAFITVQKMMNTISKNRKNAADVLKKKLFQELQKMSEDVENNDDNEIISEKLGIYILEKDLNILSVIPVSDDLLKQMEQFVGEMFQRIGEYLDLETFNEMCKGLKSTMPHLTDQEIAEIIQRNQGKFKNVETIFRGFESFGGGKVDGPTAAIIAEILKKMGKK